MKIINHNDQLTVGTFIRLMAIPFLLAGIVLIIATAWLPDPVVAGLLTALMLGLVVPVFLRISRSDPQVRRWSIAGVLVVALFFATYTTAELLLTGYDSWAVKAASVTVMFAFLTVGMYKLRDNRRKEEAVVVDTLGKSFTTEIISAILEQGYNNLAQRLERVAEEGTPSQRKRIPDCWVILYFDIGEGWREDRAINGFLQVLNELAKVGIDSDITRWWLRGAHDVLTHLVRSPDYTRTEAFCLHLLEAFAAPEVWDLQGVSVPNQT